VQQGDTESELRLAGSLGYFWYTYGYWREGRAWLDAALARQPERRDGVREQALAGAGLVTAFLGELAAGAARLEEALTLAQELDEGYRLARVLSALSIVTYLQGRTERWSALAAELEVALRRADRGNLNVALHAVGMLALEAGETARASAYLEEALAVGRREGNEFAVAAALACLAMVAHTLGDRAGAVGLVTDSVQHARALGSPNQVAWSAYMAARVSAVWAPAAALARVLGAIDMLGPAARLLLSPHEQAWYSQTLTTLGATLGRETFDDCCAAGRALSADQLLDEALGLLAASSAAAGGQSERESAEGTGSG